MILNYSANFFFNRIDFVFILGELKHTHAIYTHQLSYLLKYLHLVNA